MCDRRNMNIPEAMMDRLIANAIEDMKSAQEAEQIETLGKTLVRANKLGLRLIKGGKKPDSKDVAKTLINKLGL